MSGCYGFLISEFVLTKFPNEFLIVFPFQNISRSWSYNHVIHSFGQFLDFKKKFIDHTLISNFRFESLIKNSPFFETFSLFSYGHSNTLLKPIISLHLVDSMKVFQTILYPISKSHMVWSKDRTKCVMPDSKSFSWA